MSNENFDDDDNEEGRFDDYEAFTGDCPECGAEMQAIDHCYDHELQCWYTRFVCTEDGCSGDIHVEDEYEKII